MSSQNRGSNELQKVGEWKGQNQVDRGKERMYYDYYKQKAPFRE